MAAPKGNKFAIGNMGKPKMFKTPEELEVYIESYFDKCDSNEDVFITKDGIQKHVKQPEPYTIEGLALHLDCDMDTLLNYEKREGYEEYFGAIKRAKLRIQKDKIVRGLTNRSNPTVTIFDLKINHRYKDKTEIDITSGGDKIQPITGVTVK